MIAIEVPKRQTSRFSPGIGWSDILCVMYKRRVSWTPGAPVPTEEARKNEVMTSTPMAAWESNALTRDTNPKRIKWCMIFVYNLKSFQPSFRFTKPKARVSSIREYMDAIVWITIILQTMTNERNRFRNLQCWDWIILCCIETKANKTKSWKESQ